MQNELSSLRTSLMNFSLPGSDVTVEELDRVDASAAAVPLTSRLAPLETRAAPEAPPPSLLSSPVPSSLRSNEEPYEPYEPYEVYKEDSALARARAIFGIRPKDEMSALSSPRPTTPAATDEVVEGVNDRECQRAEDAEERAAAAEEKVAAAEQHLRQARAESEALRRRVEQAEAASEAAEVELAALRSQLAALQSTSPPPPAAAGPASAWEVSSRLATAKATKAHREAREEVEWTTQLIGAKLDAAQFAFERDEARAQLKRYRYSAGRKRNVAVVGG